MDSPATAKDTGEAATTQLRRDAEPARLTLISLPLGLPSSRADALTALIRDLRNGHADVPTQNVGWAQIAQSLARPDHLAVDVGLTTQIVHLQQVLGDRTDRWQTRPAPSAPMWDAIVRMVTRSLTSEAAPDVIASGDLDGVLDAYIVAARELARTVEVFAIVEAYASAVERTAATLGLSRRRAALAWLRRSLETERASRPHSRVFAPPLQLTLRPSGTELPALNGWPERVESALATLAVDPEDTIARAELDSVWAEFAASHDLLAESLQAEATAVRQAEDRERLRTQALARRAHHKGLQTANAAAPTRDTQEETHDVAALLQIRELLSHFAPGTATRSTRVRKPVSGGTVPTASHPETTANETGATHAAAAGEVPGGDLGAGERVTSACADPSRPILVLGMHRSGTSCLTGCLEEAGLHLGTANTQAPFNAKGNRENVDFMNLHDRLLQRQGARWDAPDPSSFQAWPSVETAVRDVAIAKLRASLPDAVWGIKDPRTLLVLSGWIDLSPRYVGTFRHPVAVRRSLQYRAERWKAPISDAQADHLWVVYNGRLLDQFEREPFPVVRFDQPMAGYRQDLRAIGEVLGLPDLEQVEFRSGDLEHQSGDGAPLSGKVREIWERLLALPRPHSLLARPRPEPSKGADSGSHKRERKSHAI